MRSDMGKVVIERPRRGGNKTYKDVRNSARSVTQQIKNLSMAQLSGANDDEIEDAISHIAVGGIESHHKVYGWDRKDFSDLLGPIEGYLRSQTGRLWDDVWSEVCANLRGTHAVEHVREHVLQMVAFKNNPEWNLFHKTNSDIITGNQFYVDSNGLLQRQIPAQKQRRPDRKTIDNITLVKFPEDKFWMFSAYDRERYVRRYYPYGSTDTEIKNNEKVENFKFFEFDKKEYVFLNNAWFTFEYVRLKDLKLNSKLSVSVRTNGHEEIGPRTIWYRYYDILGNRHSQSISLGGDLTQLIRYKIIQVGHSELRRVGLVD